MLNIRSHITLFLILLLCSNILIGQELSDSITSKSDTLIIPDSIEIVGGQNTDFQLSENAIEDKIDYGSTGKKRIDLINKTVHLWDNAYVKYQDIEVKGDYITFNFETNVATTQATFNEDGSLKSKAEFVQGENRFQYDYLKYNFKTEEGIIKQAVTKEGELFVHGATTKFVSAHDSITDDVLYNKDAIITSCNHEHPHFGIRSNKAKIISNKVAVVGPSWLEVADIPLPIWLPFGFFPISRGKSSGLIIPKTYDFSPVLGLGLRNFGYYFPINDYMDAEITGDAYIRGSWTTRGLVRYKKRYKYNGSFSLNRSSMISEDLITGGYNRNVAYELIMQHTQDTKAHPYRTFNMRVKVQTNGFNRQNRTDARNVLQDNINSNVNYNYNFPESPWSVNSGATVVQSLINKTVNMDLPTLKVSMSSIQPFKRKNYVGKTKWYQNIRLSYDSNLKNTIQATDSTLFDKKVWENAKNGIEHNLRSNVNLKILKYLSFNPSVSYREVWNFKKVTNYVKDTLVLDTVNTVVNPDGQTTFEIDTTFGQYVEDTDLGFSSYRSANMRAGLSTNLFFTRQRQRGFFRGIRHEVSPNISFNFTPENMSVYQDSVDIDTRADVFSYKTFSKIPTGAYSTALQNRRLSFDFRIDNNIEYKYYSKRDSTTKKAKLTNFSISTNYNFSKDSLKFDYIRLTNRRTSFLKNKISIEYGLTWDIYQLRYGVRVNEFVWSEGFKLPRLTNASLTGTARMTPADIRYLFTREKRKVSEEVRKNSFSYFFDNFSMNYVIRYNYTNNGSKREHKITSHNLNVQGSLPLTQNWFLNLGNFGYDFKSKGYTYPSLGLSRNLHCWKMEFNWNPRGAYGLTGQNNSTFSFYIGVNPGKLDFIKYNHGKNNFDVF